MRDLSMLAFETLLDKRLILKGQPAVLFAKHTNKPAGGEQEYLKVCFTENNFNL